MKRPKVEDERYWSEPIKGDGKISSFCFHEIYQNDLDKYIDHLESNKKNKGIDFEKLSKRFTERLNEITLEELNKEDILEIEEEHSNSTYIYPKDEPKIVEIKNNLEKATGMYRGLNSTGLDESIAYTYFEATALYIKELLESNQSLLLPSDEDAKIAAVVESKKVGKQDAAMVYVAFMEGAKWFKSQIKGIPKELTHENGAKNLLIGEYCERVELEYENGDDYTMVVPISWDNIKGIYKKAINHFTKEQT